MTDVLAIEVSAELRQIKSMEDKSYNVLLNIGEDQLERVQELMGWVKDQVRLVMVNETQAPDSRKKTDDRPRRKRKIRQG